MSSWGHVSDAVIEENHSTDGGGGVTVHFSGVTMENTIIRNNTAANHGGGVSTWWNPESHMDAGAFRNVQVLENHALGGGGGLYIRGGGMQIENVIVAGNTAAAGGGMSLRDADILIDNSVIVGNEATTGGGVRSVNFDGYVRFSNCVFADNAAEAGGAFAVWEAASVPVVEHSDFWNNGDAPFDGIGDPAGSDGNLSVDPAFLDTSSPAYQDWDLHLDTQSPLVDAGSPGLLDPDGSISGIGIYGGERAGSWDLDNDDYFEWWLQGPYSSKTSPDEDCDDQDPDIYPGQGC